MVKHNNQLPNVHLRKWWQRYVKTWFDQPGRKKSRRLSRDAKRTKLGIRPIGKLRPIVRAPTLRYKTKLREGKGFTLEELKAVGVSRNFARTIGISVDHRRQNRSAESLSANVNRLKTFLSQLVVFPRKSKPKRGLGGVPADTDKEQLKNVSQVLTSKMFPVVQPSKHVKARAITEEEKKFKAYATLRKARRDAYNVGRHKKGEKEGAV